MAQTSKKFLDANGLAYFASLLNNYPTNVVLQTVIDAIDQVKADKIDIVNSDWNATSGTAEILNKPTIPNVPSWALESTKPTYTASEVGALPSTYTAPVTSVNGQTGAVNLTIPAATTVTQTLTTGTAIGSVNGITLYAPTAYDDTALAARVTALEQIPWVTYYTGSSEPSSDQGQNGDLYFQTGE